MKHLVLSTPDGFKLDTLYNKIPNSKKVIIFAHGMTVDKDDEEKFIRAEEELNKIGFSSLRFDFRAHGKSSGNSMTDFTISGELTDLTAVIDFVTTEGFEWIGLAGSSFGGAISALYAGEHPEKIKALLLANPVLSFEKCFLKPTTSWAIENFKHYQQQLDKDGCIIVGSHQMKLGKKLFEEMSQFHPHQQLQRYSGPLLVIHGDQDSKVSYPDTVEMFESLSNSDKKFETVEGAEHGFHTEPYETKVVGLIVEFFSNLHN
jgi:uncharacterized protein